MEEKTKQKMHSFSDENEDIIHMLYSCKYASKIWADFMQKTGLHVTRHTIVLGTKELKTKNVLINLIAYFIYKNWLLESLKGINRNVSHSLDNLHADLKFKMSLYQYSGWHDYVEEIATLLEN